MILMKIKICEKKVVRLLMLDKYIVIFKNNLHQ